MINLQLEGTVNEKAILFPKQQQRKIKVNEALQESCI